MIKALIRFSAENRYLVIAAAIVALAFSWYSMRTIPLDALPDLSDTQVIVYSKWDRSPDLVEDQVTYPIITALLGAPKVKAITKPVFQLASSLAEELQQADDKEETKPLCLLDSQ